MKDNIRVIANKRFISRRVNLLIRTRLIIFLWEPLSSIYTKAISKITYKLPIRA